MVVEDRVRTVPEERLAGDPEGHARVLVISQFPVLRHSLAALLADLGYSVTLARDTIEAGEKVTAAQVDALVVDAGEVGDCEMLRAVRQQTDLPIIALVCPAAHAATVLAFDLGADDCVSWPEPSSGDNVGEMTRRLDAVLRRAKPREFASREDAILGPSGLILRPRAHEVTVAGIDLDLTPKEFGVLRLLLERRGEVLTADAISQALWGFETFGARNFVEAHISRLRYKLRAVGAPNLISTVRGVGYKVR